MDEEALSELTASVREHGVLQPILVRPKPGAKGAYQIIGGERRPRAASPLQDTTSVLQAPESIQDGVVALRSPMVGVGEVRELKYGFFRRVVPIPEGCTVSSMLFCLGLNGRRFQ